MAYDQDSGINARLRYSIILGNEGGFFEMSAQTGELFLIREIDLEKLPNPTLSLQIQASQVDNPFRQALARVDILVQDINDNSPEVSGAGRLRSARPRAPAHQSAVRPSHLALTWAAATATAATARFARLSAGRPAPISGAKGEGK